MVVYKSLLDKLRSIKWPAESFRRRSITGRLTITLLIVIASVSVIAISVSYLEDRQSTRKDIEKKADERIASLTRVLEIPIWDFEHDEVEYIAQAHMESVLVTKLRVVDSFGTVLFSAKEAHEAYTVARASKIFHQGQEIGYVEIALATDYPLKVSQQFLFSTSLVILINLTCLAVSIIFLMPRFLRRPVEQISEIANRYGSGNYDMPEKPETATEFRPIISTLDKMTSDIQSHMNELQRSEEKYRAIFESINDQLIYLDKYGKIIDVNPRIEDIYGYKPEEVIGHKFTKLNIFGIKDLPKMIKLFSQITRGVPIPLIEVQAKRKDGSTVTIEASTRLFREKDKREGVLVVARDITERRKAEEALRDSEEMFRNIAEQSPNMVFINTKGRVMFANKRCEEVMGYKIEEFLSPDFDFLILFPPDSVDLVRRNFAKHMEGEEVAPYEIPLATKDGRIIEVILATKLMNYRGSSAILGMMTDITERKKMEEQLIVTDRLASIGELASGIAHEINNPLTGVIGFSDLLLQKQVSKDIKEDVKIINREAKRTAEIIKNLLIFARRHEAKKQPVNINAVIENVLALRAYEQRVHNIKVKSALASDLPEIIADAFRLQQVFLNIIINAEYFMSKAHGKGTLKINTKRVGNMVRASFTDNGPGIPEENMTHLFDPFFTTKEVGKGTGLGLSIAHGVVTEHGGRIYAESKLGKGTTLIVELPTTSSHMEGGGESEKLGQRPKKTARSRG